MMLHQQADFPMQEAPPQPPQQQRLRRNGQRQSCEPCRLSKLRCDHESPCSRCIRRRKTCYFHPAPLSRNKPSSQRPLSLPTPPSPPRHIAMASSPEHSLSSPRATTASTTNSSFMANNGMPTPSDDFNMHYDPNMPPPLVNPFVIVGSLSTLLHKRRHPAYFPCKENFGSTANAAMLLENRALVKGTEWRTLAEPTPTTVFEDAVRLGTFLLAWFPNRKACENATARYMDMTGSATTLRPVYEIFQQRFWDTYGHYLEQPRTFNKLEQLSRELCKNSSVSLPTRPASSRAFIDSFTGNRSRWDMIGIYFLQFGAMCDLLHDADVVYKELCPVPLTREEYTYRMLECADCCRLNLCDALDGQGSLLTVLVRFKASNRLSHGTGETSSQMWIRAGSLIAAATEFELHRPSPSGANRALLYTELQKRIFTSTFGIACTLATFHGRPPLITRHYISSELPLDCDDSHLLDDDLEGVQASVDELGWRLDGEVTLATLSRGTAISNIFREEILELSLGQKLEPHDMAMRVESLRNRMEQAWERIPALIKVPLVRESMALLKHCNLSDVATLQLRWYQNVFLLERINQPAQDKKRHLDAARRILTDVVSVWSMRDRYPDNMDDVRWIIANHGIASFSSLGIDLYQQSTNPAAQSHHASQLPHRARDIQTLSKFGACLEWIDPADGNYTLCQNANKMLLAILERVLAPPSAEAPPSSALSLNESDLDLTTIGLADVPAFGVDFHDWFNSDWSMPWTSQG